MAPKPKTKPDEAEVDTTTDAPVDDQTDEITDDGDETTRPEILSRDQVMKGIDHARAEQMREDGVEIEPEDDAAAAADDKPAADDAPADDDTAVAAAPASDDAPVDAPAGDDAPAAAVEPTPAETMHKITVHGEEREITLAELKKGYQIEAAARENLRQSNLILDQAEQVRRNAQTGDPAPAPAADGGDTETDIVEPDFSGTAKALQYGSAKEGEKALKDLVTSLTTSNKGAADPAATPDEVYQRVSDRMEWDTAAARFGDEYKDIVKDDHLRIMTANIAKTLFDQSVQNSIDAGRPGRPDFYEVWSMAGEQVRGWLKTVRGDAPASDPDDDDPKPNVDAPAVDLSPERTTAKRTSTTPPSPRSVQTGKPAAEVQPVSLEQSRKDAVKDMIKSRGEQAA